MIKADLNTPIEVTKDKYNQMIYLLRGIVAHRNENGKYWIKRLWPGTRQIVELFLNS